LHWPPYVSGIGAVCPHPVQNDGEAAGQVTISRGLNQRLKDPTFADPKSTMCKEALAYNRLLSRYSTRAIEVADKLGFTPRSRRQLGID
jgi:hypothetical protein